MREDLELGGPWVVPQYACPDRAFPEYYRRRSDIRRGFRAIAHEEVSDLAAAVEVLKMTLDMPVRRGDPSPADVNLLHPAVIVAATFGPGGEHVAHIFDRRSMAVAGRGIRAGLHEFFAGSGGHRLGEDGWPLDDEGRPQDEEACLADLSCTLNAAIWDRRDGQIFPTFLQMARDVVDDDDDDEDDDLGAGGG